jgi:hypothetical protein
MGPSPISEPINKIQQYFIALGIFMKKYHRWIRDLNGFNVVLEFVWITLDTRDDEKHLENSKRNWPEHIERFITLEDVNKDIWMRYRSARQSQANKRARETLIGEINSVGEEAARLN